MFSSNTSAVSADAVFVEEVFQTHLYTGNGSTQTITNGIDLSTKGGLVWIKGRSVAYSHAVFDTARGATNRLVTNATDANSVETGTLTAFNSTGFALGSTGAVNNNGTTFASWTFRKQPKFFDVVTYTGNGGTQTISHNLGSVPGCIIYKCTSTSNNWIVYHRSLGEDFYLQLNLTSASTYSTTVFDITAPTSTTFTVGSLSSGANVNGQTYVAYLFAHNAGGFGLTGTDNVISCGSFTATGNDTITLGYEPQWFLLKRTDAASNWIVRDNMRGWGVSNSSSPFLIPNTSGAEAVSDPVNFGVTATGVVNTGYLSAGTWIYIAIRRGPMKTPTTGTSVFTTNTYTGTGAARTITTGFVTDLVFGHGRTNDISGTAVADRLRGDTKYLETTSTAAETTSDGASQDITGFDLQTGYTLGVPNNSWMNNNGSPGVNWAWRRAPGFFDVVCYTGIGFPTALTVNHNLGVAPEMMIVKKRSATQSWFVYHAAMGNAQEMYLNQAASQQPTTFDWNSTTPSATTFTVNSSTNDSGATYVAYLFASCPGVSKVGSYTGTGTTKQIDCGFTGGARFVLIKRTDSTGDWYVWDSARGIVAGNDPYLLLNSTAAEVTNTDYVDTYNAGFEISSTAPAAINANGGSFIFLAIA